jgi:hypothetical protein
MSHQSCCSKYKRPKTVAQFAALGYPANPAGESDLKNRIHNPESASIPLDPHWKYQWDEQKHKYKLDKKTGKKKLSSAYKLRHGWWFRLDPGKTTHLFDGSGDGMSRGEVTKSLGVKGKNATDRLVCFNACCRKLLPVDPANPTPVLCGFTWQVGLHGTLPAGKPAPAPGSGWIPVDSIKMTSAARRLQVKATLKNWACCMKRYGQWGRSLAKPGSTPYTFRSVGELEDEIDKMGKGLLNVTHYFKESKKGSVRRVLKACKGKQEALRKRIGIHPACFGGNKLTDYLPKGYDYKNGWYEDGYTNFSANVSLGKTKPRMAPIGLDTFPAGHVFHRLEFKGNKEVFGFVYRVPSRDGHAGKQIGRLRWFYGYCDVKSGDPEQRRYGWVPALAVKGP